MPMVVGLVGAIGSVRATLRDASTPAGLRNCSGSLIKANACAPDTMSAYGPKRTSLVAPHMSAFGGKADMTFCGANVRL
jgi:hypothetical protein